MSPLASGGRRIARSVAAALLVAVAAIAAPALTLAQDAPEVLKRDPYYLSLHPAEGLSKGTILTLHGGGWRGDFGPTADDVMTEYIQTAQGWGYDVANLGYRGGADSLTDALDAFDFLRESRGPNEPICIYGGSAGGHLALMVAAERGESVDCVIDFIGPTDIEEWGSRPASDVGRELAVEAFGEDRLEELSPINNLNRIVSPVLVAAAPCDSFIEIETQRDFVDALNAAGGDAQFQYMKTGDEIPIGHCAVTADAFAAYEEAAKHFVDRAASARPEIHVPEEDNGSNLGLFAAGAVVLVGLGVLVWHLRRDRAFHR